MSKDHVKQHFIPVCYLKGFSDNNKSLFVYDKRLSRSYGKAFEKVGYMRTISIKSIKSSSIRIRVKYSMKISMRPNILQKILNQNTTEYWSD